jgi:hypothetical protein
MRCNLAAFLGATASCVVWSPALCQYASLAMPGGPTQGSSAYGGQAADPCAPAPNTGSNFAFGGIGSAIGLLGNLAGQAQRQQACTAQRQAQWDAYRAKLTADAEQKPATPPPTAPSAAAAAPAPAPPQPAPHKPAPPRIRLAEATSPSRAIALAAAENSADNVCREPAVARAIMAAWNSIGRFKVRGVTVIDIEHLTTSAADRTAQAYTCPGVFVTNEGDKVMGSMTMKRNIVGDPIAIWVRDADQDLAHYRPPGQMASRL